MKTLITLALTFMLLGFQSAHSDSVDDLLEQARSKGSEFEKLKRVLNEEPDQNLRLAMFEIIMKNDDEMMKDIAIDAGLASADRILQAAAFKAAVMNLERIHLTLEASKDNKSDMPNDVKKYLDSNGYEYIMSLRDKNLDTSTFTASYANGEISGNRITYVYHKSIKGTFKLKDDDAVEGSLTMYGYKFDAKAKIR